MFEPAPIRSFSSRQKCIPRQINSGRNTTSDSQTPAMATLSHLTPLQFKITQLKLTEKPGTGRFDKFFESGTYSCVVCREDLFSSNLKFESGCGWPAFFDSIDKSKISIEKDFQLIGDDQELIKSKPHLVRKEIVCAKCRAHLGHIFDDGPEPTKKRYCVNSASLVFKPEANTQEELSDQGKQEPDKDIDVCCRD